MYSIFNFSGEDRCTANVYLFGQFKLYSIRYTTPHPHEWHAFLKWWERFLCSVEWVGWEHGARFSRTGHFITRPRDEVLEERRSELVDRVKSSYWYWAITSLPSRTKKFCLAKVATFFAGVAILIDFLKAAYWTNFKKEDIFWIKENKVAQVALFLGAVTTVIVFNLYFKHDYDWKYLIFLFVQFWRGCCFLGSRVPEPIYGEVVRPEQEKRNLDEPEVEYADGREWI